MVLNVSADHMDRYATLRHYADSKARIFANSETAVVNADEPEVVRMPRAGQRVISFSLTGHRGFFAGDAAVGSAAVAGAPRRSAAAGGRAQDLRPAQRRQRARDAGARRCAAPAARADARGAARFHRPAASRAVGRGHQGRALHQRFEGHQRRCDAGRRGRPRRPAGGDRRRRRQGPGLHAARRSVPRQGAHHRVVRPRRRAHRDRARRHLPHGARRQHGRSGARRRAVCASRATRCCCRRPVRASTCFATTPSAATCSPPPCRSSDNEHAHARACTSTRWRSRWSPPSCCSASSWSRRPRSRSPARNRATRFRTSSASSCCA